MRFAETWHARHLPVWCVEVARFNLKEEVWFIKIVSGPDVDRGRGIDIVNSTSTAYAGTSAGLASIVRLEGYFLFEKVEYVIASSDKCSHAT